MRKPGPSRLRRRERRAEARRLAGADNAEEVTAKEAIIEEPIAAEAEDDKNEAENVKVYELLLKVIEVRVPAEEAATKEIEVDNVSRDIAGKALARNLEVNDELCSNQMYTQAKQTPTTSPSAPPLTSRKVGGFDYWTLTYDSN